jgi:molybdate/tungstate transport system substrate-binding protein
VLPFFAIACTGAPPDRDSRTPLAVFTAGSLARPFRVALTARAADSLPPPNIEAAGSLETARKLTELQRVPDVLALADAEIFPDLLAPRHATWWVVFARDRLVLAHAPGAPAAAGVGGDGWVDAVTRPGVEVGRSDPDLDPAGYRAVLAMRLAERHYRRPGLAARLLATSPVRDVRPKSADLVALVQAGELDFAWLYESTARGAGLPYLSLPDAVNLGTAADSAAYAAVSVRVAGHTPADTLELRGRPIRFAVTVPVDAPHAARAAAAVAGRVGPDGRAALRAAGLDVLDRPELVGGGAPAEVVRAVGAGRGGS